MRLQRNTALLLVILVLSLIPLASTQAQGPDRDRQCEQALNRLLNVSPDSPSADNHKKQLVNKGCDFSNMEVEIIAVVVSEGLVRWDARVTNSGALTVTGIKVQAAIDSLSPTIYESTLAPGETTLFGGSTSTLAPGQHTLEIAIIQAVRDDYGADDVATTYFTVNG